MKLFAAKGAENIAERGEADASDDFEGTYEEWREHMWSDLAAYFNLDIENSEENASTLSLQFVDSVADMPLAKMHRAFSANVVASKELQKPGSARSTRHLEIELPKEASYQEGDHLGVIPRNYEGIVNRVATRFGLDASQQIRLEAEEEKLAHLPLGKTVSVEELLHTWSFKILVTRTQLRAMAAKTVCPPHKVELEVLLEKARRIKEQVLKQNV